MAGIIDGMNERFNAPAAEPSFEDIVNTYRRRLESEMKQTLLDYFGGDEVLARDVLYAVMPAKPFNGRTLASL